MKKQKNNLIIISILLILLLVLLFFLISLPAAEKNDLLSEKTQTFDNIIDMSNGKIMTVSIKNLQDNYEFNIENKEDKNVYILSGFDENKTSQSNAATLYDSVVNLKPVEVIDNVEDFSIYGLSESSINLTVTFDNDKKITLILGNDAPLDKGSYIKIINDPKVYLISKSDKEIFLNEKEFYLEKD